MKQVPFLDLKRQHARIHTGIREALERVVDSQAFILSTEVAELEREIAAYGRTSHAIGCASGSDALLLALMALGIGPGDKVLTTPFTFFATAGSISLAGAQPVFADIDPATFNLDPDQAARALRNDPRIRAILPVHLYGACAYMDELLRLGREYGIPVIEDAAQAIGAERDGRRAGSMGAVGCFSFFPTKNLGGYGDGGMLTTADHNLDALLRALRVHGSRQRYFHERLGLNSRLDSLQAAVLRVKLRCLDHWTEERQRHAGFYRRRLDELAAPVLPPPAGPAHDRHVYHQFVIRAGRRDELRSWLQAHGVASEIYYPLPLHLQECFRFLGRQTGDFPAAEEAARTVLALPIFAELEEHELDYVCRAIAAFYRGLEPDDLL
jgi:dTDP-4-amino-4,6-dideoxygalactose transaminase